MPIHRSADPAVVAVALDRQWPDARCALRADDPWELLVAAILSARASDDRVNAVMAALAARYHGPADYRLLAPTHLATTLRSLPLYRQKARAITEAARWVVDRFGGTVPVDPETLARIPGVGRKTAAVVAGNAYGHPVVAADVHVQRLAHRLGWAVRADEPAAERGVATAFPPAEWVRRCHQLIRLGRAHCRPRRPWCSRCPVAVTCPRIGVSEAR